MARKGQNNGTTTPSSEEQTVNDTAAETQTEQPTAVSEDQATIDKLNQDAAEAKARYEASRKAAKQAGGPAGGPRAAKAAPAPRTLQDVIDRELAVQTYWMHLRLAASVARRMAVGQSEGEATQQVLAVMGDRVAATLRIMREDGVDVQEAAKRAVNVFPKPLGSLESRRAAKAAGAGQSTLDEQIAGAEGGEQPADASVEQPAEAEAATA